MKFKNVLESMDSFKIEHNFKFTKKAAKGSLTGFICTVIWYILFWGYFLNRVMLFWNHHNDATSSVKTVLDFEELGKVEFGETEFATGVYISSASPRFKKVFESEEEIFQYIDIYSV